MAGSRSSRRRRWLWPVVLVGLGAAGWVVRSRRAAALDLGEPWPVPRSMQPPPPPLPPRAAPEPARPTEPTAPRALLRPASTTLVAPVSAPTPPLPAAQPVAEASAPDRPRPSPRPRRPTPPPRGAAVAGPDGAAPGPEFTIKGNAGSRLFHLPSSPYYARMKAQFWFRTAEDARAAGFTEWVPKRQS